MNDAIDKIIIPTVGRQVWYFPAAGDVLFDHDAAPMAATVARVWSERSVNLLVLGRDGTTHPRTSVLLKQAGIEYEPVSSYCEWMPYQKGQAAKPGISEEAVHALIGDYFKPGAVTMVRAEEVQAGIDRRTMLAGLTDPGNAGGMVAIDKPTAIGSPASFMGRRERERNAAHDKANETLLANLARVSPPDKAVGGDRNELYEGLFDGESDGDRHGRFARAALGLSAAGPVVDVPNHGAWVAGKTGGFAPAGAMPIEDAVVKNPVLLAFSVALEVLKEGAKIARLGWNGKGLWLELQRPDAHSKMTLPYIFMSYPEDATNTPGARVPWLASQTDLLADDWLLVA